MSKKDYIRIAKVMQAVRKFIGGRIQPQMDYVETELATIFREDNPAFDEVRFLKACRE